MSAIVEFKKEPKVGDKIVLSLDKERKLQWEIAYVLGNFAALKIDPTAEEHKKTLVDYRHIIGKYFLLIPGIKRIYTTSTDPDMATEYMAKCVSPEVLNFKLKERERPFDELQKDAQKRDRYIM